jgi:opacity protein-like surface antigen
MSSPTSRSGRVLLALVLVVVVVVAPAPGAASGKGDYLGTFSASALAGYSFPNTDAYGSAFAWRVAGGYSPVPELEVDLELGAFSSGVDQPEANGIPSHTIASGNLDVKALCLTVQWRPPQPEAMATAYALAGLGWYDVSYRMDEGPRQVFLTSGVAGLPDQAVEAAWGFHVGAGIEYALGERLFLLGEARYLFLSPEARGTAAPGSAISGSIDLNTWLLSGGVKVVF